MATTIQSRRRDGPDVLLVEDDPSMVQLVETAFEEVDPDAGVHVTRDGVDALDFLFRRGDHAAAPEPDLVLLDLGLPRKDGKDVLQEIRDGDLGQVPVVIFSDSTASDDVSEAYDLGANAYVNKPQRFGELVQVVEEISGFWLSVARRPT